MLDIKLVRENPEKVRQAITQRGGRYLPVFEELLDIEKKWRKHNSEVDMLRAKRNKAADHIGLLKRKKEDAGALLKETETLKTTLKTEEDILSRLEKSLNDLLLSLPNIPLEDVPVGKSEQDNKVLKEAGAKPQFSFPPKDHQDLGQALGILDFETATKLSGARFSLLKGLGARLERALISLMLDIHTKEHGYTEILPPFLVTAQTMTGTGQLPKFAEELYKCQDDDTYLIPTAEVPLTNLHRDETLEAGRLPLSYVAWTACFRREAGSYGKDTRGLIRNHQFNKVELVKFCLPEESPAQLEKLTQDAVTILERLELPYRVVQLCTGDLGFASAKTYDLEVWMAGEQRWREISSCSTFTDFQARRIGVRFKSSDGKKGLVHTLNGSGLAIGRTVAAVLENGQQEDGSVKIPKALEPYCGFSVIKKGPS